MKRLSVAALAAVFAACGPLSNVDEFRNASPSRQGVDIKVPSDSGKALTASDYGSQEQALIGERAHWYTLTRAMTLVVNGGTAWVLNLCEQIIKHQPTTIDDTHAVWGPHTNPLSPNTFKFTVTKVDDGYDYLLEAKAKDADDSAYVTLISGHHVPGAAEKEGSGTFSLDWDAAQTLPEHSKEVGKADFTYSRNANLDVTVGVKFKQAMDEESGQRVDADYAFSQIAGGDGSFEFVLHKDMTELPNNTPAKERLAIKSRWQNDGAGRCDVKVSQGDIVNPLTLSECWGSTFLETYYADSLGITAAQDAESACVFPTAEYTEL
ncbi:MAG: hypothetical protein ACOX6T_17065 [Myxococcales bacterium]|jgi:hypothetical protein